MKKIFTIVFLTTVAFACSRKTTPQSEIIISNQEKQSNNSEATVTNTGTAGEAVAGKNVYTTRCGRCHGLKPVEKYNSQEWENILKSMIPKAKLSEIESKQVRVYVMEHAKK